MAAMSTKSSQSTPGSSFFPAGPPAGAAVPHPSRTCDVVEMLPLKYGRCREFEAYGTGLLGSAVLGREQRW